MADEPRRSGRPTKGQHTKIELADAPPSGKKKGGKRGKKQAAAEEGDEEEVIRCVCGVVTTEDDPGEAWIACDNCGVWQHNVCVGVSTFEEDIPKNYLCEQCDPVFHKDLLDALERGEELWEERKIAHQNSEEGPKKKGKKGKGKRPSDPKAELGQAANGKAKSPSTPVPEVKKKDTPAKGVSSKRKVRDESQDTTSAKVQKTSTAHITPKQKSPPSGLPTTIAEIDSAHQGPAKHLLKGLNHAIPIAVKTGVYTYSSGDTHKTKGERLAIEIEDAITKAHPDKASYSQQFKTVSANLKTNQELCNGLLTRTLSPAQLAVMTSDDMASKELKQETAKMKARADKASIMITEDDGPRIRRTHKGDEVIEGDDFTVDNDIPVSRQRRRSMLDPNADMATRSRENSPGNEVELPDNINDYRSHDDIRGSVPSKLPISVETKHHPVRKPSAPNNFDINNVFSKVQSPTGPTHPSHIRRQSTNLPPASGPGEDPDIDRLLQDDGNDSPPYSPAEYNSDPETIWRGMVTMDSIAMFPAVAKHVGGADLTRSPTPMQWSDILQKDLRVAGRIDQDKANEYLCSLRYSPPTDVVVVNVTPTGEAAGEGFQKMFEYFNSKNRYGVLTNKGVGNIRDTYLVPVPATPGRLPDFLVNLEGHRVPEDRPEAMILVALVIRNQWEEQPQRNFESAEAQSPSIQNHPVRQLSMSGTGPAMSPIAPQNAAFPSNAPSQSPHPPPQLTQEEIQRRQEQERAQHEGEDIARRILGTYAQAPTVGFLMPQAFQMRSLEWEVIKGILVEDERARNDLQHLSQVLELRMSEQPTQAARGSAPVGNPPA